ncbi:PucR family transcriptional regulator, partial [Leucobacter sp. M11]|uniref:PucR family transcriptional regulator n=1 Tax=Leucobacter sp. M11 TaxID=2993565 RepID=UPI002D7FEA04
QYRLALFEVPPPTPFIAVSKAVAQLLGNDELRATQRVLAQQRRILGQAFTAKGTGGVLASLRAATGAEAAVYRADGAIEAHTQGFVPRPGMADAARSRATGGPGSHGESTPDRFWAMHGLGLHSNSGRSLVTSGARPPTPAEQSAVTAAALVLSLQEERSLAFDAEDRERRERIAVLLLRGDVAAARTALAVLAPEERLPAAARVIGFTGDAESLAAFQGDPAFLPAWFAARHDRLGRAHPALPLWVLCPADGDALGAVLALAGRHRLDAIVGRQTALAEITASWLSALARLPEVAPLLSGQGRAARVRWAEREGPVLTALLSLAADRPGAQLLGPLATLPGDAPAGSTEPGAAEPPLSAEEAATLRDTLAAFLRHNGQRGPAASELSVHRNTLRNRLERVESLSGRSLDDPDDRAELWLALRALEQHRAAESARTLPAQPRYA